MCGIYLKNIYNYKFRLIVLQTLILISLFPHKPPPCVFFLPIREKKIHQEIRIIIKEKKGTQEKYTSQSLIIFVIKILGRKTKSSTGLEGLEDILL